MYLTATAQDAVLYSQLFNQPELFNPAVNGTAEDVRIGFFFRNQWMEVDGAPNTVAFDIFVPLKRQRFGLGISAFKQNIGLRKTNFLLANANSYIYINRSSTLSFGIRAGMEYCSYDKDRIISIDNSKLNYQELNSISPAFNIGLVYKTPKFHIGLSSFQISFKDEVELKRKLFSGIDMVSGYYFKKEKRRNKGITFHTYIIIKTYFNNLQTLEPGSNIYITDKIGIGIGYRLNESIDFNVKIKLTKSLVMGYTYDYSTSGFSKMSNGSNEFYLGYAIGKKNILLPF